MVGVARSAWLAVVVLGGAAVVATWLVPSNVTTAIWLGSALVMLAAAGYAIGSRAVAHRFGWWLLLASCGLGLLVGALQLTSGWLPDPVGELAAGFRYLLFVAGMLLLLGVRRTRSEVQTLLDAAIIAAALSIFVWAFAILPRLGARPSPPESPWLSASFAIFDLVVLSILVRIILTSGARTPVMMLLGAAGAAIVIGNLTTVGSNGPDALGVLALDGVGQPSWKFAFVLVAAAALHPAAGRVGPQAPDDAPTVLPRGRFVTFVLVAVLAPVLPVVGLAVSGIVDAQTLPTLIGSAALTCVLLVLMVLRLGNFAQLAVQRADALQVQSAAIQLQAGALHQALKDQQLLQDELTHRAMHDPLTGLANRTVLTERLLRELHAASRSSGGLLFIDLDDFKDVNDSLGHPTGDELLVEVGHRLLAAARAADTVARLGGDEFAVLMSDCSIEDCRTVARRVIEAVRGTYELDGRQRGLTCSGGLLMLDPNRMDVSGALRDADLALYAAKRAGGNQYAEFVPRLREQYMRHNEVADGVRSALADNALRVMYQPIVELATGATVAVEALLRWRPADGPKVSPSQFIAVAEDIGLIADVGTEVLRDAAIHARQWRVWHPVSVSVNVSGRQLVSPDFASGILQTLHDGSVPPEALILEITETVLVTVTDASGLVAMTNLTALRREGVRIAVDDFGTGYSSLAYLQRLPIDILKIDQSFTSSLESADERSVHFVGAILRLGSSLGLPTVAEGVESARQAELLRELDCPLAQGYYFGRPCHGDDVLDRLNSPSGRGFVDSGW